MSRTARYKIEYVLLLGVLLAISGVAAWKLRSHPLAILGMAMVFFIPGRVSGFVWRDLYRGRRLLEAREFEAGLESSRRFIGLVDERPLLRHLWWLAWGIYTRDPKAMALNNAGSALLELGRWKEAESSLREAVEADPQYAIPYFNLAVLAEVRRDSLAAREHAQAAVELGFSRDVGDRVAMAAGALLARIEGRGPALQAPSADAS